jgi:hypothetical protein
MTTIRRPGAASVTVLIGLCLSFAAAHAAAPEWSRRAGLDVWNLPAARAQFRESCQERDEMEARAEQMALRREVANHVAARLIDGLPLATATDELMELLQHDQAFMSAFELIYSEAPSLRHRFALHAIERASRLLQDDPLRRMAVEARLRAEYQTFETAPDSPPIP